MLYYDRIDLSEAIDLGKSNYSKECMVYHYWFFNHGFKYQDSVCNGCHDLLLQCFSISDITIITVNGADYCCIIHGISKSEAINSLEIFVHDYCWYIRV